jgi:hypothetical protein
MYVDSTCSPHFSNYFCKDSIGYNAGLILTKCMTEDTFGDTDKIAASCDATFCKVGTMDVFKMLKSAFGLSDSCVENAKAEIEKLSDSAEMKDLLNNGAPACVPKTETDLASDFGEYFKIFLLLGGNGDDWVPDEEFMTFLGALCPGETPSYTKPSVTTEDQIKTLVSSYMGDCKAKDAIKLLAAKAIAIENEIGNTAMDTCPMLIGETECNANTDCVFSTVQGSCISKDIETLLTTAVDKHTVASIKTVAEACDLMNSTSCEIMVSYSDDFKAAATNGSIATVGDDAVDHSKPGFSETFETTYPNALTKQQKKDIGTQIRDGLDTSCAGKSPTECPLQVSMSVATSSKRRHLLAGVAYDINVYGRYSSNTAAAAAAAAVSAKSANLTSLASVSGASASTITPKTVVAAAKVGDVAGAGAVTDAGTLSPTGATSGASGVALASVMVAGMATLAAMMM